MLEKEDVKNTYCSKKCEVKDGELINICTPLEMCLNGTYHQKGLCELNICDTKGFKNKRIGIVYKKQPNDRGLVLNICPFCGTDISTHLKS